MFISLYSLSVVYAVPSSPNDGRFPASRHASSWHAPSWHANASAHDDASHGYAASWLGATSAIAIGWTDTETRWTPPIMYRILLCLKGCRGGSLDCRGQVRCRTCVDGMTRSVFRLLSLSFVELIE